MVRYRKTVITIRVIAALLLATVLSLRLSRISIEVNLTHSHPCLLFALLWGRSAAKEELVAFRFSGSRYYPEGTIFAKKIAAIPGDRLEIRRDRTVWINGVFLDTVQAKDSKGRPVEPFYYVGVIPAGKYFLYSPAARSYDSRYFGLVDQERLVGKVITLAGC